MNVDKYCKFYVDTTMVKSEFEDLLVDALGGEVRNFDIYFSDFSLHVFKNDEYYPDLLAKDPNEFLFFPFCVELECENESVSIEAFIDAAKSVFNILKNEDMRTVAACDFEEVLPQKGRHHVVCE